MTDAGDSISLGEAASSFLTAAPVEADGNGRQEIHRFVRWYGWDQSFSELTPSQVDNYAEHRSQTDADFSKKLGLLRAFLTHAKKKGWSQVNLSTHLKGRKAKSRGTGGARLAGREPVRLTPGGHQELKVELAELLAKRPRLIEDIRRAAADKDFKENAPLDAAREQRGYLEGRIKELEEILGSVVIMDGAREISQRVTIGDGVTLLDIASGGKVRYTLVSPSEVDVANGKISGVSPIGKAVVGKLAGDEVEVAAPAGKLRYRILRIGNRR